MDRKSIPVKEKDASACCVWTHPLVMEEDVCGSKLQQVPWTYNDVLSFLVDSRTSKLSD